MKLLDIIGALPALQRLSAAALTLQTLYSVRKMLSALNPEIEFYNAEREKIIEKYREEGSDPPKIRRDCVDTCNREIAALLDTVVTPEFKAAKIPISENIRLSNNDVEALVSFAEIIFDEDDEDKEGEK